MTSKQIAYNQFFLKKKRSLNVRILGLPNNRGKLGKASFVLRSRTKGKTECLGVDEPILRNCPPSDENYLESNVNIVVADVPRSYGSKSRTPRSCLVDTS